MTINDALLLSTRPSESLHRAEPPAGLPPVASSLSFPEPRVPKNPVLGWSSFSRADRLQSGGSERSNADCPSTLAAPHKQYLTSARVAIALALQRLGVTAGSRVLVPAYHCLSMVEPVVFCGATPLFYPLSATLEVPLADLASTDLTDVRAIIVTHYFGFPQAMRSITAFANARGIPIIEDCAHAAFGMADDAPIGSWGDYAAASLMKFFPVYDGGCLTSTSHSLDDLVLQRPSGRFEIKALLNSIERGLVYRRFPGLQGAAQTALRLKDSVWRGIKRLRTGGSEKPFAYHDPAASDGVNGFDAAWLDRRISFASQLLVERLPVARIVARRRAHYRRLDEALRDLSSARPLFARLPDGVVPYVFPLWVDRPERVFARLKIEGVPLFRWERLWNEEAARIDPLSARYATEIFQLPCHQELTHDELDWIIDRVKAAFAAADAADAAVGSTAIAA